MRKDLPQAEEMLKAAVKVDEKASRPRLALAEFYLRSGKRDQAENEYIDATTHRAERRGCCDDPGQFLRGRQ